MLRIQVWFKSPPVFQLTDQTMWLLVRSLTLVRTASTKVISVLLNMSIQKSNVDGKCRYEILPSISKKAYCIAC